MIYFTFALSKCSRSPDEKVSKDEETDVQHDGTSGEDIKREMYSENKQQLEEEEIKEHAVTIDYSSFKSVRKGMCT